MYTYITSLAPRGQIYPFRLSFSLFFFFFFVPVSCSLHDVIFIFPPFSPSRLFGRTCSYHPIYIIRFDIIFFFVLQWTTFFCVKIFCFYFFLRLNLQCRIIWISWNFVVLSQISCGKFFFSLKKKIILFVNGNFGNYFFFWYN